MIVDESLEEYAAQHTTRPPDLLEELERETRERMPSPGMLTGRIEGRFLNLLVRMLDARRVLEIGTFTGYGTLSMAEGLPDGGAIFTCEIDPEAIRFARAFLDRSPHGKKIRILEGDDLENLAGLEPPFDFIFIDGDKKRYIRYYEEALRLLRPGGCMAIDNVLWKGSVLDPQDEDTETIHRLNEKIAVDGRVEAALLTVRDGVQLIRKRPGG